MNESNNSSHSCSCNTEGQGFCITTRHTAMVVAAMLAFSFFVFMTGYFMGKKRAVTTFCQNASQGSLADQIYSSLCGMPDYKGQSTELDVVVEDEVETTQEIVQGQEADTVLPVPNYVPPVESQPVATANSTDDSVVSDDSSATHYYAELIGFGTSQGATLFAKRLAQKNIKVVICKRLSKTAKGRKVTWYQVVTEMFSKKDDLLNLVDKITLQEKLKDVRIVANDRAPHEQSA